MIGILIGLALCFGLTYLISASAATKDFRASNTEIANFFNNPVLVGMAVSGVLSLLFCGNVAILLIDIGVGALVGLGVKAVRDKKS
jgi:hypothetical protein